MSEDHERYRAARASAIRPLRPLGRAVAAGLDAADAGRGLERAMQPHLDAVYEEYAVACFDDLSRAKRHRSPAVARRASDSR
jgi:hypothetical protein